MIQFQDIDGAWHRWPVESVGVSELLDQPYHPVPDRCVVCFGAATVVVKMSFREFCQELEAASQALG